MAWEELDIEEWAKEKGVDINELRRKEKLIKKIIRARKNLGLTQKDLAYRVGVSQSRISQIESRIKVDRITFDVLFSVLKAMGFELSVTARKVREPDLEDLLP